MLQTEKVIDLLSDSFNISKEIILRDSLKYYIESRLKNINIEIFKIAKRYEISSIEEFEKLYEEGIIEEENTFDDYKKLDRLEYEKDRIIELLEEIE